MGGRILLGAGVLVLVAVGVFVALPPTPPTGPGLIERTTDTQAESQFVLTDVTKDLKKGSGTVEGTASVAYPMYGFDRKQLLRKQMVLRSTPKAWLVPVVSGGKQTGDYELTFEPYRKLPSSDTKSEGVLKRARAQLEKQFGPSAEYRIISDGASCMVAVGKDGDMGVVFLGDDFMPGDVSMLSRRPEAFTLLQGDEAARAIAGAYRSP